MPAAAAGDTPAARLLSPHLHKLDQGCRVWQALLLKGRQCLGKVPSRRVKQLPLQHTHILQRTVDTLACRAEGAASGGQPAGDGGQQHKVKCLCVDETSGTPRMLLAGAPQCLSHKGTEQTGAAGDFE